VSTTVIVVAIVVLLVVGGVAYYVLNQGQTKSPQPTYKLAVIFPGATSDNSYNTLGYLGMEQFHNNTGVQVAYSENVAVTDVATTVEQYIAEGYNMIWLHGGQFIAPVGASTNNTGLASQYPNVTFLAENDAPVPNLRSNVWIIDRNFPIGMYALGAAAALATTTGTIGYIGGVQIAGENAQANAIIQGAAEAKSTVKVLRVFTGDPNDAVKARSVAQAMMASGVDVILTSINLGNQGVIQAINGTNVLLGIKYTNMYSVAPNNMISSFLYNFSNFLTVIYHDVQKGQTSGYLKLQYGTDAYVLMPLTNVPSSVNQQVQIILNKLSSGQIQVPVNSTDPGSGP
jgi:basic membrane protein A